MEKRKKVLFVSVIMMLMMAFLPMNTMAAKSKIIPNDKTGIPDKVLYQTILKKLGKKKSFTEEDAAKIKRLNAHNEFKKSKIKSLRGIGKLKNLKELDLSFNDLKTLTGIEDLNKLTSLSVHGNQLKNIKPIRNLTNIKTLHITGNKLTSLSGIENLKQLTSLYADGNQLVNLKEIRDLVKLKTLWVSGNKLSSLEDIEKLTGLEALRVSRNKIKKLPNLNRYPNLDETEFKYNKISEKEFDKKLPKEWPRNSLLYQTTVELQNLVGTIHLIVPTSRDRITKHTKQITGIANKNSFIVLEDLRGKKIAQVKSNRKGKFTFKNLNLMQWAGKRLVLRSYIVDTFYDDESSTLKRIKFTIPN